ncbi:hemin ABC transporter substrate-binding protein [Caldimonas brevitalea]|uniref:Hemin ABC transporter substrate-binding protein n=1 Tax=Caldimonas brevitalea TaxID=413882 RepID=A0A0G3BII5_9BURK|nr:hemin ABC transporter substrate-binding protein [Caldimonas brevitalea]
MLAVLLAGGVGAATAAPGARVVSLGGGVTEIVHALGAGSLLVGTDRSSVYPESARQLPQVGYYRSFSVEGVASLRPDLVLASDQAGPRESLQQLQRLGMRVVVLPSAPTLDALAQRVMGVAVALQREAAGRALAEDLRQQVARLRATPPPRAALRVLLLSSHTGRLQAAGSGTAADAMLRLAGAENVFAAQHSYKPVAPEAVAALRPEAIVTTASSVAAAGGLEGFASQPGVALTPAARARRIVVMDELLLLGFGPRLPQALRQLQAGLAQP